MMFLLIPQVLQMLLAVSYSAWGGVCLCVYFMLCVLEHVSGHTQADTQRTPCSQTETICNSAERKALSHFN